MVMMKLMTLGNVLESILNVSLMTLNAAHPLLKTEEVFDFWFFSPFLSRFFFSSSWECQLAQWGQIGRIAIEWQVEGLVDKCLPCPQGFWQKNNFDYFFFVFFGEMTRIGPGWILNMDFSWLISSCLFLICQWNMANAIYFCMPCDQTQIFATMLSPSMGLEPVNFCCELTAP